MKVISDIRPMHPMLKTICELSDAIMARQYGRKEIKVVYIDTPEQEVFVFQPQNKNWKPF